MKAGYGATGDRNERKRENRTRNNRPTACRELRQSRHFEIGMDDKHAHDKSADRRNFHERAQVVARGQQ